MFIYNAILKGEMKLSDAKAFYACLVYMGGMTASTAILLQEEHCAQDMYDDCNRVKYNKKNITRVHHISWNRGDSQNRIEHRHFTNLESEMEGYKIIENVVPNTAVQNCGTILKRHYSNTEPLFLPFKSNTQVRAFSTEADNDNDNVYVPPPTNIFAGRLYEAANRVHSLGISPDSLLEHTHEQQNEQAHKEDEEIKELLQLAEEIANENGEVFPEQLDKYWAMKKNRNWIQPSIETASQIVQMYDQGKGYKNRATRYTAEQAVAELRESYLLDKWDQRVLVCVQVVKSKFSQWFKNEKEKADIQAKTALRTVAESQATTSVQQQTQIVAQPTVAQPPVARRISQSQVSTSTVERIEELLTETEEDAISGAADMRAQLTNDGAEDVV